MNRFKKGNFVELLTEGDVQLVVKVESWVSKRGQFWGTVVRSTKPGFRVGDKLNGQSSYWKLSTLYPHYDDDVFNNLFHALNKLEDGKKD